MKRKRILMTVALLLALSCAAGARAENMGVQVIGGPDLGTETVSLDDLQVDQEVTIENYAILKVTGFVVQDELGYYEQGKSKPTYSDNSSKWKFSSGQEADYAILKVDLTNLAMKTKNFLDKVTVKAIFNDEYEYAGWAYQLNYNNIATSDTGYVNRSWGTYANVQNKEFVIDKADNFSIDPMYKGHYFFGCTLPNAVLESKAPLRMEITIDDNELTYNIRK